MAITPLASLYGAPTAADLEAPAFPGVGLRPAPPQGLTWASNPTTKKLFVSGYGEFDADDEAALLEAAQAFDPSRKEAPPGGGWTALSPDSFAGYVEQVRNPSMGRLLSRNVGRGVDQLQQLAGYGLMLAGAEETGRGIVETQEEQLRKTSPYDVSFTQDVLTGEKSALDWAAANLAAQGPNLLLSLLTGGAGYIAGTAARAGLAPAIKAVASPAADTIRGKLLSTVLTDKFRQTAGRAAEKQLRGAALDAAEQAALKKAAGLLGAAAATRVLNYGMGASEIYGETVEAGVPDRGTALLGAVPWEAMETLGEFFIASKLFGGILGDAGKPVKSAIENRAGALLEQTIRRLGRAGRTAAGVGTVEGLTEAGQEALLLAANPNVSADTEEGLDRLINSFAAGFGVGGTLGGVGGGIRAFRAPIDGASTEQQDLTGGSTVSRPPGGKPQTPAGPSQLELPFQAAPAPGEQITLPLERTGPTPPARPYDPGRAPTRPLSPLPPEAPTSAGRLLDQQRTLRSQIAYAESLTTQPGRNALQKQAAQKQLAALKKNLAAVEAELAKRPLPTAAPAAAAPAAAAPAAAAPAAAPAAAAPAAAPAAAAPAAAAPAASKRYKKWKIYPRLKELGYPDEEIARLDRLKATNLAKRGTPYVAPQTETPAASQSEDTTAPAGGRSTKSSRGARTGSRRKKAETPAGEAAATPETSADEAAATPETEVLTPSSTATTSSSDDLNTIARAAWADLQDDEGVGFNRISPADQALFADLANVELASVDIAERMVLKTQPDFVPSTANATAAWGGERSYEKLSGLARRVWQLYVETSPAGVPKEIGDRIERLDDQYKAALQSRRAFMDVPTGEKKKTLPGQGVVRAPVPTQAPQDDPDAARANRQRLAAALAAETKQPSLPRRPFESDTIRLFRVQNASKEPGNIPEWVRERDDFKASMDAEGRWFAADPENVAWYKEHLRKDGITPEVTYVDLPKAEAEKYRVSNLAPDDPAVGFSRRPKEEFFLPREIADRRKKLADETPFGSKGSTSRSPILQAFNFNVGTAAFNADGTPIARSLAPQQVSLLVKSALQKFVRAPRVHVFKDQADMRAKAPVLYERAAAARPQGDFDSVIAAGYSFGRGEVLIFSDRIANAQHLRFVLAHEALGHFGLESIMPAGAFKSAMRDIYRQASRGIQNAIDSVAATYNMSREDATAEFVADYAGMMESSLLFRIWTKIKSFLNKLGVNFNDDDIRYLLSQSNRYVRYGFPSSVFDATEIASRYADINSGDPETEGRFSVAALRDANAAVGGLIRSAFGAYSFSNLADLPAFGSTKTRDMMGRANDFATKYLRLTNFYALNNPGLYSFNKLLDSMRVMESTIVRRADEKTGAILVNSTSRDKDLLSDLLYQLRDYGVSSIDNAPGRIPQGPLFTIGADGNLQPNEDIIEELRTLYLPSLDELRAGVSYQRTMRGDNGRVTSLTQEITAQPNLTEQQYEALVALRRTIMDAELALLEAAYEGALKNVRVSERLLRQAVRGNALNADDRAFFTRSMDMYMSIHTRNATKDVYGYTEVDAANVALADKFLADLNAAVVGTDEDRIDALRTAYFTSDDDFTTFADQIRAFRSRRVVTKQGDVNHFLLQNELKQSILAQIARDRAERTAKKAIASGRVSTRQDGTHQVRVLAYIGDTPVQLPPEHASLLVHTQLDGEGSAIDLAEKINAMFAESEGYTLLVRNPQTGAYELTENVRLKAVVGVVQNTANDPSLDFSDFLQGMRLVGINPTPAMMENIITTLTTTSNAMRNKLHYDQTPGYNRAAGLVRLAEDVRAKASLTAKVRLRPEMRDLLNLSNAESNALWAGDIERVMSLKDALDALPQNSPTRRGLEKTFAEALSMYKQTNTSHKNWDGSRATRPGFATPQSSRLNEYHNYATDTLAFLEGSNSTLESNTDATGLVASLKMYTAVFQLALSLAQAVLNLGSYITNLPVYLATLNPRTGFGGGFSLGPTVAAMTKALSQVGTPGMNVLSGGIQNRYNTAKFYADMADPNNPAGAQELNRVGLTRLEAQVLADEILSGKLIPAQTSAYTQTALRRSTNRLFIKSVETVMSPFNLSEQAIRRAGFLAAYRLEFARQIADGVSEANASQTARDFAVEALDLTFGEYSSINRPPAWRGGIASLVYMYKIYPTTVIQLFNNLSRPGKIAMLGMMILLAGAGGLPFVEDVEDLLDTLAQKILGLPVGPVRAEFAELIDSAFPGASSVFLQGALAQIGMGSLGSRFGMANLLPGTGLFLAGADFEQEFKDIAGPAAGTVYGVAESAMAILSAVGSGQIVTSPLMAAQDILRVSPITGARIVGDTLAYLQTGAIVDKRGYVVAPDASLSTVLSRLAGFYPKAASDGYTVVKYSQRLTNYQKEMTTTYRTRYIKSIMSGDFDGARRVVADVAAWNQSVAGTGLEIRNFVKNSQRALKEARKPAVERARAAAPTAARADVDRLAGLFIE